MDQINKYLVEFKDWEASGLLTQLAQFLAWVLFIALVAWLARKTINRTIKDNSMRYNARKVVRLVVYVLIILLAVITFTGNVKYFSLAIGLISAGLAFALQEVILSIAGWIAIFSTNIYKPGDRIEIKGVKGDVIDIGITKTTLMEIGEWVSSDNYSGRIVKISNAFVFRGPVFNYSSDFPFLWDEVNLPIRYGSDIQMANNVILETAREHLDEYAKFANEHWGTLVKKYLIENATATPTLTFQLTDNWIQFNLRFVVDYKKRRITKHLLFDAIRQAIDETDGKVKLASATFELVGVPEIKMQSATNNSSA